MDMMSEFFPLGFSHYLAGGLVIGFAVSLLFITTGLVGGMSGVFTTSWSYLSSFSFFQKESHLASREWRLIYAIGLMFGAFIWLMLSKEGLPITEVPTWRLIVGGFIAGFGARLGNGCTSGHGICGMASLSGYSLLSVLVFLTTAIITANLFALL